MASPATAPMPIRGGQGWGHISTSARHRVWSRRDLQGKCHPRKTSGNRGSKRKKRIRQGPSLPLRHCSHCLSPTAQGREGPFPRVRSPQDHGAMPKAALGHGKPRESESVPTGRRRSRRHRATLRTGCPQPSTPLCWSGESTGAGTGSRQHSQLCDSPPLLFSCSQQRSPRGVASPHFSLCSWPEVTPVPSFTGATTRWLPPFCRG